MKMKMNLKLTCLLLLAAQAGWADNPSPDSVRDDFAEGRQAKGSPEFSVRSLVRIAHVIAATS